MFPVSLSGCAGICIGSITKTFTATLIQKEIVDGYLKLDATFNGYIKQRNIKLPSYHKKEITIGDLLTHTSGLPLQTPEVDNPVDATNPYKNTTFSSIYNYLNHVKLTSEPGSSYCYSNIGYSILGDLLSKISGKSYNELLSEEIFKKLKMSSTTLNPDDQIKGRMVQGYDINGNKVKNWDFGAYESAGGIITNLNDMMKWLDANINPGETDLSNALNRCHKIIVNGLASTWSVIQNQDYSVLYHGGLTGGYRSFIVFSPEKKIGMVLLTPSAGIPYDSTESFGFDIINILTEK